MACDMCGSETALVFAKVEGTQLRVCSHCAKFGTIVEQPKGSHRPSSDIASSHVANASQPSMLLVVSGAGALIKAAREKAGFTQDVLAQQLHEKSSLLHNIETGHIIPSLDLARKFEKMLHVRLVEMYTEPENSNTGKASLSLTLGDILKPN